MKHLPLGYKITEGMIEIDEPSASKVRALYQFYLEGNALAKSAKKAAITGYHGTISRILSNEKYTGKMNYPKIIEPSQFELVQQRRRAISKQLGRDRFQPKQRKRVIRTRFYQKDSTKHYDNPFEQAEHLYRLIGNLED